METLCRLLQNLDQDGPVRRVLVGAHWTAVAATPGDQPTCGLASTLLSDAPHGEDPVRDVGELHRKSVRELAEFALSDNPLEAGIGLAAINALLAVERVPAVEMDALDWLLTHGRGRRVALVGHFPFIPRLRRVTAELWVLEQHPAPGEWPARAAPKLLPHADVVAITGTTLINHTFDNLMALCPPQARVMMLGPTTPMSPLLFEAGVEVLAGAGVVDEATVLLRIEQGGNFRQLQGIRRLTMARET